MCGVNDRGSAGVPVDMAGFPSPLGDASDDESFDEYDEFVPEHVPEPGKFLDGHRVLSGADHVDFHEVTRAVFEERTVYDMTFGYNLARLNLDARHEDAGYRYAEEDGDPSVLRAEFSPTTPFCPQTHTLTVASFRAWNGLSDRHDYDVVRVRVDRMHHRSDAINDRLEAAEAGSLPSGSLDDVSDVPVDSTPADDDGANESRRGADRNPPF